jgi:ABC-2 type transport system ATP-binding protein
MALGARATRDVKHMLAIETVSLTRRFRRVVAVDDLDLQVPAGATYALMGPNGAGKTTLIRLLMGLLRPSSGRAQILGYDASRLRGKRLESVGYVSEAQVQPDWLTVGAFLSYWRPFYPTWDAALERRLVSRFGLPEKQELRNLSRGMRMKAVLTSALSYHPKLIVLDEPLSGLDPMVRDDLLHALMDVDGEQTVLISSHDLAEVDSFASHVGYMDAGRLRLSAPVSEIHLRFRNVQVDCTAPLTRLQTPPPEWLQLVVEGRSAKWVETGWDPERSVERVRERFGIQRITSSAMTLREVFLTMARADCTADGSVKSQ